jgi:hypothetical protein
MIDQKGAMCGRAGQVGDPQVVTTYEFQAMPFGNLSPLPESSDDTGTH